MIHELPVRSLYVVHDLHVGSWYMSNMVVHDARVTLWFMIQEIPYGSWYMITCTCWFMMHELPHGSWCMSYLMVHDAQVTCGSWSISYWVVHDTWVTKWFMIHELPSGSWCSSDGLKTQYRYWTVSNISSSPRSWVTWWFMMARRHMIQTWTSSRASPMLSLDILVWRGDPIVLERFSFRAGLLTRPSKLVLFSLFNSCSFLQDYYHHDDIWHYISNR